MTTLAQITSSYKFRAVTLLVQTNCSQDTKCFHSLINSYAMNKLQSLHITDGVLLNINYYRHIKGCPLVLKQYNVNYANARIKDG